MSTELILSHLNDISESADHIRRLLDGGDTNPPPPPPGNNGYRLEVTDSTTSREVPLAAGRYRLDITVNPGPHKEGRWQLGLVRAFEPGGQVFELAYRTKNRRVFIAVNGREETAHPSNPITFSAELAIENSGTLQLGSPGTFHNFYTFPPAGWKIEVKVTKL